MRREIERMLNDIEKQRNIKILYAVESGSRAWGFASPDSDYDVRYIYVRRLDDYVRVDEIRDTIEKDILASDIWNLAAGRDLYKYSDFVECVRIFRQTP